MYRFLWGSKSHGIAFRRALDSLSPLLLEARVEATPDKLVLCSAADGLVAQFEVPFSGANGDYVNLSTPKCVFSLDLKEVSSWLSSFREGFCLELSVSAENKLGVKFYNEAKSYQHQSDLTSLLVSQEAVFLPVREYTEVGCLVEVSGPALNAVVRHHAKSNSHARFFVEDEKLCVESCLRAVDDSRRARTLLGGVACLTEDKESLLRVGQTKTAAPETSCLYSLEVLKKVLRSGAFQEKKTGRVVVGVGHEVLYLVFKREGGPWLKYTVLADTNEPPPPPLPTLAPLAMQAEEAEQMKVIRRKKKTSQKKRKRDEPQAGA